MFLCTCIRPSYMLGALAISQVQQLEIAEITDMNAALQCVV